MKGSWIGQIGYRIALSTAIVGAAMTALAQDYPAYKGDPGRNASNIAGPGIGVLTWYSPNTTDKVGNVLLLDNLAMPNPVTDPPYNSSTGVWNAPPDRTAQALVPYVPPDLLNPGPGLSYSVTTSVGTGASSATQNLASTSGIYAGDTLHFSTAGVDATVVSITDPTTVVLNISVASTGGETVTDTTTPRPDYGYSQCIASAQGSDPRVPLNPTDTLSTWTWSFRNPVIPFYEVHNYAVYAYIPIGPTTIGGTQINPQRFYVYEIDYAGGSYVDVLDTQKFGGGGLIRLGQTGTDPLLFPSDGINPIQVKLFNTVPRDRFGVLTTNPSNAGPDLDLMKPRPLVYADMVKIVPIVGTYAASPVVSSFFGGTTPRTISALNSSGTSTINGATTTTTTGVVQSFDYNTGNRAWKFSPIVEGGFDTMTMDNAGAGVITTGSAFASDNTAANYLGTDYLAGSTVGVAGTESTVEYTPGTSLGDGSYDIYVWIPGDSNGQAFAHSAQVEVHEGLTVTKFTVDESGSGAAGKGWIRIGGKSFTQNNGNGNPLKVVMTNLCDFTAEPGDNTRTAFADAVRFVSPANLRINSTPIQTTANIRLTPGGTPTAHGVVIACSENGVIYCLDAQGRGDGTTDVIWTYPSTRDASNPTWKDPNINAPDNIDGKNNTRIAQMPSGFNLGSALIETVGGKDYLYIASTNGRVYCIDMAGRGDFNTTTRKPGTTTRIWTYPDDYPAPPQAGFPLPIQGSVAFGLTTTSLPTLFVPTMQGRIYALDAQGNAGTHTTTPRWTYPLLTDPNIGPMSMTPAVNFNQVYIGTQRLENNSPGQFVSLNIDDGTLKWTFSGATKTLSDFRGGPATIDALTIGNGMPDTVFASNDNGGIYGIDANTGTMLWETYELTGHVDAPLTFTYMNVYNTGGAQVATPVVIAPQVNGRVSVLHAVTSDLTLDGNRFAQGYDVNSANLTASVAVGWDFMYICDNAGYIYAFSQNAGSFPPGTVPPVTPVAGGNNPGTSDYSHAALRFITKAAYNQLIAGTMYYAQAVDPSIEDPRNPKDFEWGETLYMLVTNFKYKAAGLQIPPSVGVFFTTDGVAVRSVFGGSQLFPDYTIGTSDEELPHSGYSAIMFTLQGGGSNALTPGPYSLSVGFNTVETSGNNQNYTANQNLQVVIANPIAIDIPGWDNGASQRIGYTNVTSDPDNIVNGDPLAKIGILGTEGDVGHAQSSNLRIGVIDRSVLAAIQGGQGLSNVRVQRGDLLWQTGATPGEGAILKPLSTSLYPGYEDTPTQYPNVSLDYPDIHQKQVTIIKGGTDQPENPVLFGSTLNGATAADGSPLTEANWTTRALNPTSFDFTLEVPRFQPANQKPGTDLNGGAPPAGYLGSYFVYVDINGNGSMNRGIQTDPELQLGNRPPYRSFTLATGVTGDERLAVTTPTLDLGTLAEGAGYTPDAPGPTNLSFDPWSGTYASMFKTFDVVNEGNVNLLDLRVVKSTTQTVGPTTTVDPWHIYAPANEDFAYLDGTYDLWSDMDPAWAPMHVIDAAAAPVIGPKSRVGDRYPRKVTTNPYPRINPNTGITAQVGRVPGYPIQSPRVAVTIPFGFPIGTYIGLLRVVEKDPVLGSAPDAMTQQLDTDGNPTEPYSEPGLRITFKPREARGTSTFSPLDAPFIDALATGTESFRYSNMQPGGFRNPSNGSLVVAMSSNRPGWTTPEPTGTVVSGQNPWRIYVASVQGIDPKDAPGTQPLRDLNAFVPDSANNRWFLQSSQTANGFPDASLDSTIWGPDYLGGAVGDPATAKYGSPVFPANGMLDPFRDLSTDAFTPLANSLMAFVGEAKVKSADGTPSTKSEIFVAPVTVDNAGAVGIGNITAMTNDADASKGRPSILETTNGFVLFYSATVAGRSNIYYVMPSTTPGSSQYDGSYFTDSTALDLGEGFESVSSPHVTGRIYSGSGTSAPANGDKMIDITFTGKLRGRPISEVFYGRMGFDLTNGPTGFLNLPIRTRETVFTGSEAGTYLAAGVRWVTTAPITLEVLRNGVYTDIEKPSTRQTERGTGIITFDTLLGGKAYLDPTMGTVRLSGSVPPHDAALVLTYQPRLLRVSEGTAAGYASPTLAVDQRYIPDVTYWKRADGTPADPNDAIRTGRYLFTYARAAAGAGQAARPMLKSMRFGVDLPTPIFTDDAGATGIITVAKADPLDTGNIQYFQVDPAKKKIYFTADDEDRLVNITYEAADEATGADLGPRTISNVRIDLITERTEELVPMDQATNEANFSMFLDPFDHADLRRPGLVWMLWSSTRAGTPDIYMQTIAPRFTPIITGK